MLTQSEVVGNGLAPMALRLLAEIFGARIFLLIKERLGLGSVVVFVTSAFAIWSGASDGFTALVIVQAGVFAEASRQLVSVGAQVYHPIGWLSFIRRLTLIFSLNWTSPVANESGSTLKCPKKHPLL